MKNIKYISFVLLGLAQQILFAQQDSIVKYHALNEYFQQGKFSAHTRTYFMSTINQGRLKDDYALATGAGIGYRSAPFHGFGFGLNGFFIFNVTSSNLAQADPFTNQINRYELGLFDVTHLDNNEDLDRLEEAYFYYQNANTQVTFGRMHLNTPFINPQDGRMRPSLEEGIHVKGKKDKLNYQLAYLWAMSPRSTVLWYPVAQSIGTYPTGVDTKGKKSAYSGKLSSNGIALLGLVYQLNERQQTQLWNTFIDNISNTLFLQHEIKIRPKLMLGLQYTRQDIVNNGGNSNKAFAYMENKAAQVYSVRMEYSNAKTSINVNYSQFSQQGRFLFPREWGREPFYTFIPRERSEGNGGIKAVSVNAQQKAFPFKNASTSLALGIYDMPDVTNFKLNKYGMGDYLHANLQLKYSPAKQLKGLNITALLMAKQNLAGNLSEKNLYNRSNLAHLDIIIDYYFGGH